MIAGCRAPGPAAGPIVITLAPEPAGVVVRATGLSGSELKALRDARFDESAWHALMRVTVSGQDVPVAGRYLITADALEFQPRFPFDAGRAYSVRVDPARLAVPRQADVVTAQVSLPRRGRSQSTTVEAISPSAAVWPENMLRFYIYFSAPMSRGAGVRFVHLLDDADREVPDAILAAYADLWNADTTRLTVFFDPGRVKRGVGPNVTLGRAIVQGRRYAIAVDAGWPDANGQTLAAGFRREFTAGPAAYEALRTADWRVEAPAAGSRAAVVVTFPAPLDRPLLERAIGVRRAPGGELAGQIVVGSGDTTWRFTPAAAWLAGPYDLAVLTLLEDPAGNRIGRAFEVLTTDTPPQSTDADVTRVRFNIK